MFQGFLLWEQPPLLPCTWQSLQIPYHCSCSPPSRTTILWLILPALCCKWQRWVASNNESRMQPTSHRKYETLFAFPPNCTEFLYKMFNGTICHALLEQVQAQDNVQSFCIQAVHALMGEFSVFSSLHNRPHTLSRHVISSSIKLSHYEPSTSFFAVMCGLCIARASFFRSGPMVSVYVCMISLCN